MPRYFIELAYRGSAYAGFQVQENARTVQGEVERAFALLHRVEVSFTGSSRTDAGVHALQNYFHFDFDGEVHPQFVYKMNAVLPSDIVVRSLRRVPDGAHSRFDALSRSYVYRIHRFKDPFLEGRSFYFPYKLDLGVMEEGAALVKEGTNFFAFAKTNSQVKHFGCRVLQSTLVADGERYSYHIEANRFLRGMVRLLTGSLLKLGRHKISLDEFRQLFDGERKAGYSVPAEGLYLECVHYPEKYFC